MNLANSTTSGEEKMYLDVYVVASLIGVAAMIVGSVWAVVKVKELVARDSSQSQ